MNPAIITAGIAGLIELIEIYKRWKALKTRHAAGQPITPADIDALFAPFEHKTYDDYLEEARARNP